MIKRREEVLIITLKSLSTKVIPKKFLAEIKISVLCLGKKLNVYIYKFREYITRGKNNKNIQSKHPVYPSVAYSE